jgi:hypothetical protein
MRSNCQAATCRAECNEDEVLIVAYCGPRRRAATFVNERTVNMSKRPDYKPSGSCVRESSAVIAIAAVLPGKLDNIGSETLLVVTTAGPCVASSDAARAPLRHDARRHAAALAPAQCRHGDARA